MRASGPEKSHFRSGDSSQTPTSWRTAWCSATASPNSVGQNQPSHSMNSAPSARWTPSKAVRMVSVLTLPPSPLGASLERPRRQPRARAAGRPPAPSPPRRSARPAPGRRARRRARRALPWTGAATAFRSFSRSPAARAQPSSRTFATAAASSLRSTIVRSVKPCSRPPGSSRSPKASATLPVAVAWATLGRPTRATLCTDDELWTKSTVIASGSPGTESVAVSPVASARARRWGRATSRRSSRASTAFPSSTRRSPRR